MSHHCLDVPERRALALEIFEITQALGATNAQVELALGAAELQQSFAKRILPQHGAFACCLLLEVMPRGKGFSHARVPGFLVSPNRSPALMPY